MEMKKYITPEMEAIEIKYQTALLAGSGETVDNPGSEPGAPGDY